MLLASISEVVKDVPTVGLVGGLAIASALIVLGIMAWTAHQSGYRLGFFDGWKKRDEAAKEEEKIAAAAARLVAREEIADDYDDVEEENEFEDELGDVEDEDTEEDTEFDFVTPPRKKVREPQIRKKMLVKKRRLTVADAFSRQAKYGLSTARRR